MPKVPTKKRHFCVWANENNTVCGKGFARPNDLVHHIRTHTGEKPCICQELNDDGEECKITFAQLGAMRRHIKLVHNKDKNHECNYIFEDGPMQGTKCGMCFGLNAHLQGHIKLVHNKEKNHECNYIFEDGPMQGTKCGMCFGLNAALQGHINVVHNKEKNHECNYIFEDGPMQGKKCGMCFGSAKELSHHIQHHTGLYRLVCELFNDDGILCGKGCTTPERLADHVMANHTDKNSTEYLKYREKKNQYQNDRYTNDPIFRNKCLARSGIRRVFEKSGFFKLQVSEEITGCSAEDMVVHLNNNDRKYVFGDDVTFGKLVHDHVKPVEKYDFSCYIELLKASNWRNIQLLTEKENSQKSNRFTPKDKAAYYASWRGIEIEKEAVKWKAMGRCNCPLCVVCCSV